MPLYYAHPDGVLRRFGTNAASGAWTGAPDAFTHRTTIPDETNAGPGAGVYANRPLNPAADRVDANVVYLSNGRVETTGGVLISSGSLLMNKVINGTIDGRVGGKMVNCEVRGYADPPSNINDGGGSRPLIKVLDHQVTTGGPQFEVEHVKVMPQTPSPHWESAIGNRGYKVKRSILRGTTDIFGVFGTNALGGYANIRVEDSAFGHIVFWQAASGGIVHPSDINTHGELIQDQGHLGGIEDVVFDGNAMWIRYDPAYGHVPTAPAEVPATVFALTCTPQSAAVLQSAGTLEYNWMYGTTDRVLYDSIYYINLGTIGGATDGARTFAIRYNKLQTRLTGQKGIVMSTAVQGTSAALSVGNTNISDGSAVAIQGG